MAEIYPYATLPEDPTTEAAIYWIDERDEADGSEQTLLFDGVSEHSTGEEVPESDSVYLYTAFLDDLEPDTTYTLDIDDGSLEREYETLPDELPSDGLDFIYTSDWHIDRDSAMPDPEGIDPIRDESPRFLLFGGDYWTLRDDVSESNTEVVLDLFRDYYDRLNQDRICPSLPVPGNHEVGNHNWTGTGTTSPESGYFQFFFESPKVLDPPGENYGRVTVGDYLQILALDTHSARPSDVGDWLESVVENHYMLTVPIHHSPMLPGGDRGDSDDALQDECRKAFADIFDSTPNCPVNFSGHIHLRNRSVPWTLVDEEPSGDFFEVGEKYLVENDSERTVEFGGGYRSDRDPEEAWHQDYTEEELQFYSVTLQNPQLEVRELDEDGDEYDTHTFSLDDDLDEPPTTAILGDIVIGDAQIGH